MIRKVLLLFAILLFSANTFSQEVNQSEYSDLVFKKIVASPNGQYILAYTDEEPRILVWDIFSGNLIKEILFPYKEDFEEYRYFYGMHTTNDGTGIYVISYNLPDINTMYIEKYDFDTWKLIDKFTYNFNCDYNKILSTALSYNDQYLAVSSLKKTIVLDLNTKKLVNEYCGKNHRINFSYDNRHIATVCENESLLSVTIWELGTTKKVVVLEEKAAKWNTAWFSADMRNLKIGYWKDGGLNYVNYHLIDSLVNKQLKMTFSAGFDGKGFIDGKTREILVEMVEEGVLLMKGEDMEMHKFKSNKLYSTKYKYQDGNYVCTPDGKYLIYVVAHNDLYINVICLFNIEKKKIEKVLMPVIDDNVLIEL